MKAGSRECQEFRAEVGHDRGKGAQQCRDAKTLAPRQARCRIAALELATRQFHPRRRLRPDSKTRPLRCEQTPRSAKPRLPVPTERLHFT